MIRATSVVPAGQWTLAATDSVVLDFDERHRRRIAMTGVRGLDFLLDLSDAVMLRGGDALALEDGRLVEVVAAPEPLVELRASAAADLVRLAWHIGNRHLPAQVMAVGAIRIRRDHVIEDMLRGLGARLRPIEAPFDPEGGAYATAPADVAHAAPHGHGDHHGHDHDAHGHSAHGHGAHGHGHDHGAHDHGARHGHEAGGDHQHDDGHDHKHHDAHAHAPHHDPGHRHG